MQTNRLVRNRLLITGSNGMLGQRAVQFYSSKENVEFTIEDENVAGVFKNIFDGTKRDFNNGKNFSFKVSDYAVFEK